MFIEITKFKDQEKYLQLIFKQLIHYAIDSDKNVFTINDNGYCLIKIDEKNNLFDVYIWLNNDMFPITFKRHKNSLNRFGSYLRNWRNKQTQFNKIFSKFKTLKYFMDIYKVNSLSTKQKIDNYINKLSKSKLYKNSKDERVYKSLKQDIINICGNDIQFIDYGCKQIIKLIGV